MNITAIYRKFVPENIRDIIWENFLYRISYFSWYWKKIIKCKFIFLFKVFLPKTIENDLYAFLGKYGYSPYPFKTTVDYNKVPIRAIFDFGANHYYILHNGKKLYFPENLSKQTIRNLYRGLLIEQDKFSAHRYVQSYEELRGKVLLDVGAAEGIFSLDVIEEVEHVYLFECNPEWRDVLKLTFAKWKDKVTIVSKYVTDISSENAITLDDFMKEKNQENLFIKMDIEGFEFKALQGAKYLFKEAACLSCSICTYHNDEDVQLIEQFLQENKFVCNFTDGYLLFDNKFRKGVIRGNNGCSINNYN